MIKSTLKFAITIIIIYHKLISVNARHQSDASLRSLSRQTRETGATIEPAKFISAVVYLEGCGSDTLDRGIINIKTLSFGYRTECEDDEWIIDWNDDDLGREKDKKFCQPKPAVTLLPTCWSCICVSDEITGRIPDGTDHWNTINLFPQESEIGKNKVIRGVKFVRHQSALAIEIQVATLLLDGTLQTDESWESVKSDYTSSEHYTTFEWDTRTIFLDELIVPSGYVVTGVKFAKIEASVGKKGVKLQIRGTKYDSNRQLLISTNKWFDYTNHLATDSSYASGNPRTEIDLTDCDDSPKSTLDKLITDTNRYVRIRGAKIQADNSFPAIPYFSNEPKETTGDLPLQGLGLSYKGSEGYGGYVTLKVHPTSDLTTTTSTTTIPDTTIVTTIDPYAITSTTTTPAPTTNKPKIISFIKLRTLETILPTTETAPPANISTEHPPIIQPKLKRLRIHPTNVSCNTAFQNNPAEDVQDELFADLFVPIAKNKNSGSSFFSQLRVIFHLYVLFIFIIL